MSPKGVPNIGRPRSLEEREQDRITTEIEAREAALDDAATLQSPDGGVIARLRSQLKRLDPRDDQYKEVAKAISDGYARLYPGEEPDNAR